MNEVQRKGELKMRLKKYTNWNEAKDHFRGSYLNVEAAFTLRLNAILLTPRTLEGHINKINSLKGFLEFPVVAQNCDMRKVSTVKAHLKWMAKRGFEVAYKGNQIYFAGYTRPETKNIDLYV